MLASLSLLIAAGSAGSLSDDELHATLRAVNYYRRMAGLPDATFDPLICKAAQSHADYRLANSDLSESAHVETEGRPGFTGVRFWERMKAAGFSGRASGEDMSFGDESGLSAVDGLFAVPYHRSAFISSAKPAIGIGKADDPQKKLLSAWVFDFAASAPKIVAWPPDGATGVPPEGDVEEIPDPMAVHGIKPHRVGYVISLSLDREGYTFAKATLYDDTGKEFPCYVNHPGNDKNCSTQVLLIPAGPLRRMARYSVSVRLTDSSAQPFAREWSFTTGTPDSNFVYENACSRFAAGRYRGVVATVDDDAITLKDVVDAEKRKVAASKTYRLLPESRLHHSIDPLGLDLDRVVPAVGSLVRFTLSDTAPDAIADLLILKNP